MKRPPLDSRITEQRNPRSTEIDLATPLAIVDLMQSEDATVAAAVATQRLPIARAIELAEEALRAGGRLFYLGAGTSGRLGALDAVECPPTFGTGPEMVQAIIAGGAEALVRAREGAEDDPAAAAADIAGRDVGPNDFVVGIAASGTTPYVHAGLVEAKARGAMTAVLACSHLSADWGLLVDVPIVVVTGPEVVTGSTRLKAGTATKMVLNMISTGAMIRLGKTYGNLMVDLRATSAKLRGRAERILMEACGLEREAARAVLAAAGGRLKVAIVMCRRGVDAAAAERALESGGGIVRRVTGEEPHSP